MENLNTISPTRFLWNIDVAELTCDLGRGDSGNKRKTHVDDVVGASLFSLLRLFELFVPNSEFSLVLFL